MHKICSDIRGKLNKDSKFKCQTGANHHKNSADDCPDIELNDQIMEKCFCLGDTKGEVDLVISRNRSGSIKFRDLLPLLVRREEIQSGAKADCIPHVYCT